MNKISRISANLLVSGLLAIASGCATQGQTGAAWGSGIGALAGQLIGGDTEATLIGAAVGAGVGYVIGNEKDKQDADQLSASSRSNDYEHSETGTLGGTRWRLVDWGPRGNNDADFSGKIVEFGTNGKVKTITTLADGKKDTELESYRVTGNKLIVNKPGYLANYRFSIEGGQLIVDTQKVRALLSRI